MAEDVGGISISFRADAQQLQNELQRLEQKLRQFDSKFGNQTIRIRAQVEMPGSRALLDARRELTKGLTQAGAVRAKVAFDMPAGREMTAFGRQLQAQIRPVHVKVIGDFEWGQRPPASIRVPVTGSGGGGAAPAGAPGRTIPQAPARPIAAAPAAAPARPAAAPSANRARAAAQVRPASRSQVFRDWSDQLLLEEYMAGTAGGAWQSKAREELISRGFQPPAPTVAGRPAARGYTGGQPVAPAVVAGRPAARAGTQRFALAGAPSKAVASRIKPEDVANRYVRWFHQATEAEIKDGLSWYDREMAGLMKSTAGSGWSPDQVRDIAASFSRNNQWAGNVTAVKKFAERWRGGARAQEGFQRQGDVPGVGLGSSIKDALQIAHGDVTTLAAHRKEDPFSRALGGQRDAKAIDRWMAVMQGYEGPGEATSVFQKGLDIATQRLQKERPDLAERLDPRGVQAVPWVAVRNRLKNVRRDRTTETRPGVSIPEDLLTPIETAGRPTARGYTGGEDPYTLWKRREAREGMDRANRARTSYADMAARAPGDRYTAARRPTDEQAERRVSALDQALYGGPRARGFTGEPTWAERLQSMQPRPSRAPGEPLVLNTMAGRFPRGVEDRPVEQIPPQALLPFRELDRERVPRLREQRKGFQRRFGEESEAGPAYLNRLTEQLKREGIREPLELLYDKEGFAQLADGNHRLAAAIRLGLQRVPVTARPTEGLLTGNTARVATPGATTAAGITGARALTGEWRARVDRYTGTPYPPDPGEAHGEGGMTPIGHQYAATPRRQEEEARPRTPAGQMRARLQPEWGGFTYDPREKKFLEPQAGRQGRYFSGVGQSVSIPRGAETSQIGEGIERLLKANEGLRAQLERGALMIGGFADESRQQIDLDVVKVDRTFREATATQRGIGRAAGIYGGAYSERTKGAVWGRETDKLRQDIRLAFTGVREDLAKGGTTELPYERFRPVAAAGGAAPPPPPPPAAPPTPAAPPPEDPLGPEATRRRLAAKARLDAGVQVPAGVLPKINQQLPKAIFAELSSPAKDLLKELEAVSGTARERLEAAYRKAVPDVFTEIEAASQKAQQQAEEKAAAQPPGGATQAGPAQINPALLRQLGVTGTGPVQQRGERFLQQARVERAEATGLGQVRAVGTTIAGQFATIFGGRAGRQAAIQEMGQLESAYRRVLKAGDTALSGLDEAQTEFDQATIEQRAPEEIGRLRTSLDDAKRAAAPYQEVLGHIETEHDKLAKSTRSPSAALANFGASFAGSIAGMFLFQTALGVLGSAGEAIGPVLQESSDRLSGFQANANRLRPSLASAVQQFHGYADAAIAASVAQTGMSASTLNMIRPVLALDAQIEAGNKALEQRVEFFRAYQGTLARQGGLGQLAGTVPAGVTQTQGGFNLLGIQTPIGGTPSTAEQLGRQMQFATVPGINLGQAGRAGARGLGFEVPEEGGEDRDFDFGRDVDVPIQRAVRGFAAAFTSAIPGVGDFYADLAAQDKANEAAEQGIGELSTSASAGAAVIRDDFNAAVTRAGDSTVRLAKVSDKSAAAQQAQIAALETSGVSSLVELARGLKASRTTIEGAGAPGETKEERQAFLERVLGGLESFAKGSVIPDPAVMAEEMAKPIAAALQMIDFTGTQQREQRIPGQTFLSQLATGRFTAEGQRRGGAGSAIVTPKIAEQFGADTSGLIASQESLNTSVTAGRDALRSMISEADRMGKTAGPRSLLSQFDSLTSGAASTAAAIRDINVSTGRMQMNLQVRQINEQLRQANQSLADARSFVSGRPSAGPGGGQLGVLQNQARAYERQSAEIGFQQQALGMQSQVLGLQNAQLGIRSRELGFQTTQLQFQSRELGMQATQISLMQRQRQINFQRALAGFVTPGQTPQEIAARQKEAQLEADLAQSQQNIAVSQFDIEKQVFDLERQQLPIAQAQLEIDRQQVTLQASQVALAQQALSVSRQAFTVQQAMIDVQAARAIETLGIQIGILNEQARVVVQVQVNTEAIENYQAKLAEQMAQIESLVDQAFSVTNTFATQAVAFTATVGGFMTRHMNTLVSRYAEYLRKINAATRDPYGGGVDTRTRSTGGFEQYAGVQAAGYLGTISSATRMTVGEAGPETIAILRNPRSMTLQSNQGGGGASQPPIIIDVHDNNIGSPQEAEELAAIIARRVEETMSRRGSLLGLRSM